MRSPGAAPLAAGSSPTLLVPWPRRSASRRETILILRGVLMRGGQHGGGAEGLTLGTLARGGDPFLAASVGVV